MKSESRRKQIKVPMRIGQYIYIYIREQTRYGALKKFHDVYAERYYENY